MRMLAFFVLSWSKVVHKRNSCAFSCILLFLFDVNSCSFAYIARPSELKVYFQGLTCLRISGNDATRDEAKCDQHLFTVVFLFTCDNTIEIKKLWENAQIISIANLSVMVLRNCKIGKPLDYLMLQNRVVFTVSLANCGRYDQSSLVSRVGSRLFANRLLQG